MRCAGDTQEGYCQPLERAEIAEMLQQMIAQGYEGLGCGVQETHRRVTASHWSEQKLQKCCSR